MARALDDEITATVRQHLAAARDTLTGLLEQLDGKSVAPTAFDGRAPAESETVTAAPATVAVTPSSTIASIAARKRERRESGRRLNGVAQTPETPSPAAGWPALRREFRTRIDDLGLSLASISPEVQARPGTLEEWLSRDTPPPSSTSMYRIRGWLARQGRTAAGTAGPVAGCLTDAERDRLRGHLSLDEPERQLRERFGAARTLLEEAAAGAHLNAAIITRLRTALGNGAATPP
jgi:hypothetical protein